MSTSYAFLVFSAVAFVNCTLQLPVVDERLGNSDGTSEQELLEMFESDILLLQQNQEAHDQPRLTLESMAVTRPSLAIGLEASPGFFSDVQGAETNRYFDNFCESPVGPMSIDNAAWLSFFSANEYSHPFLMAPLMLDLGFGEGQGLFALCAEDVLKMQNLPRVLTERVDVSALGICGRQWLEVEFGEPSRDNGFKVELPIDVAEQFLNYIMQNPGNDDGLQFYSEDGFSLGGSEGAFENGSTQVMWAEHSTRPVALIVFRGTENKLVDFVTDSKIVKTRLSDEGWANGLVNEIQPQDGTPQQLQNGWGEAHIGFVGGMNSVTEGRLLDKIRSLAGKQKEGQDIGVWIAGHSLGGALATLFAAKVLDEMEGGLNVRLDGLYTFGSPRVGNPQFERKMTDVAQRNNTALVRVRNNHDTVTRVPFWNYEHVGKLAQIIEDEENDDDEDNLHPFTLNFDQGEKNKLLSSVSDHDKVTYFERIQALREDQSVVADHGCLDNE